MNSKFLANKIKLFPFSPGIYIFKNKDAAVLYVGKANKLRQRIRSYFAKTTELTANKQIMVKKIADIETIIVSTENEALILESTLIKKHRPPYNVVLKDDKNYQFIKIDYRTSRPIISTVRRPEFDAGRSQARYFGPYTSGYDLQESLRLLRRVFPWRKKDKDLTKFEKDLLQKRTLGVLPQSDGEYQKMIGRLVRVLEGHSEAVILDLQNWMKELSQAKRFEQAGRVRDQIKALQIINSRQKVVSVHGESQDVISLFRQNDLAAVNVFIVRAGKLIDKRNFLLQHAAGESDITVLDAFLTQYYSEATDLPKEIIIPTKTSLTDSGLSVIARESTHDRGNPDNALNDVLAGLDNQPSVRIASPRSSGVRNDMKITIPSFGKKRDMIKLGETNARDYLERSLPAWQQNKHEAELKELQTALKLEKLPNRIEGYDISNIQGQWSVGAMVVFTGGEPDKKEYRKFKIKTVRGANDFASLAEMLKRRFTKTDWPKPDLVLLDGGKGQLSTVLETLFTRHPERSEGSRDLMMGFFADAQNDGLKSHQFIALAKRAEEIFQGENLQPINLPPTSPASRLLQRIRDEAHRFGQAYYHSRHAKANIKSRLDEIPGVGPKAKKLLLQKFGSLAGIKQAEKNDIIKLIGKSKAERLLENV